jgi:MFS transporter, ACS family, D-galactonate transporter
MRASGRNRTLAAGGSAVVMLATGWYSQRLLSRGISSKLARGILGGLSVVLGGAVLTMLPYVPGTPVKIALTTLGVALPSAIYVISNAVVGEITPAALFLPTLLLRRRAFGR